MTALQPSPQGATPKAREKHPGDEVDSPYDFRKYPLVSFMQQKLRVLHKTPFTGKIARKFTGPM